MRKKQYICLSMVLALMAAALVIALFPVKGWTTCSVGGVLDTDCDGLTDAEELAGITTPGPLGETFPACTGAEGEDRRSCVDQSSPDVFVIVVKALENPYADPCTGVPGETCTNNPLPQCTGSEDPTTCSKLK
jgi:hypothetical protein